MNASLVLLALRRTLHPALAIAALALALLLVGRERTPSWLAAGSEELGRVAGGLARAEVWGALSILLAPVLLLLAARTTRRWREDELDWLAPRRRGPWTALASTWVGQLAGTFCLLLAVLAAGELAAADGGLGFRVAGELAAPAAERTPDGTGLRWTVPDPGYRAPAGSRARVELDVQARAGTTAEVVFRARRLETAGAGEQREARRRLTRAGWIEIELPPGPGDLELSLAREGEGASIALARPAALLLAPAGTVRAAGLALLVHVGLALGAGIGLALGLGAWLGGGIALLLVGASWAAAALGRAEPPAWFPGARIPSLLAMAGEGFVPELPGLQAAAGAALSAVAGLALARAGLWRWRGAR